MWLFKLITYILLIVKVPCPLHPDTPVSVQFPEMVLPVTAPLVRVRTFCVAPPENSVVMVIPNVPVTFPLKLPARVKLPVSDVSLPEKQGPFVVNVKLLMLSPPPLACVNVVEKA